MAEGESSANPGAIAAGLFGFLAVVAVGWFMFGGAQRADLRGYLLAPPSAPQVIIPEGGSGGIIQGSTTTAPTYPTSTPQ